MTGAATLLLAALSIWDYPARQPRHVELRNEFVSAGVRMDTLSAAEAARSGTELLPDDPTWRYNLACSEAKLGHFETALDELKKAIELGFRDPGVIESDGDFSALRKDPASERRFKDLVGLAERKQGERILFGPLATLPVKAVVGGSFALGAQNLAWDFDSGCFVALMEMTGGGPDAGANAGDLYFNRDGGHSVLKAEEFPGITRVMLDAAGRERRMDLDFPNMLFPCPVFGNCSRAMTEGPFWRSMPRALVTHESHRLALMHRLYRANQIWVFPACWDCAPLGVRGDLFASVTPYWIATQGRSWSDQYYLRAALEVSRSLKRETKREAVAKGLLAPTVQTLIRKSLKGVKSESDYLSPKAHPTAFPANGLDMARLKASAAKLTPETIPPVAVLAAVGGERSTYSGKIPELTYVSPCAWAFVLRGPEPSRTFVIRATGGDEYAFASVHGDPDAVRIERTAPDIAKVVIDRTRMTPTNRVDVAVFAKTKSSDWGAPSFVSFAVVDPTAEYYDPVLTGTPPPKIPVPAVPPAKPAPVPKAPAAAK